MTTAHSFNQVFFDDVRLPADLLVGEEGDGWRLAKVTLANERVSLSSAGSLWGAGPSAAMLLDLIRDRRRLDDPVDASAAGRPPLRGRGAAAQPAAHAQRPAGRAARRARGVDPEGRWPTSTAST